MIGENLLYGLKYQKLCCIIPVLNVRLFSDKICSNGRVEYVHKKNHSLP